MKWSKLHCPHCQSPYPLARLYARYWSHECPACRARLAFSVASLARSVSALKPFSILITLSIVFLVFAIGPDFFIAHWVLCLVGLVAINCLVVPFVLSQDGEFVPYEQAREQSHRTRWRDVFKART
jgi:hypothetical protein